MADKKQYAIGDIHGCVKTFSTMLFDILKVNENDEIYLLGDYIDRGPSIKAVIDLILLLRTKKYNVFTIFGNHEKMLIDHYLSHGESDLWLSNGAANTLKSFGVKSVFELNQKYIDFFLDMHYYYTLDNFILTHAGLNFFAPGGPFTDTHAMVWTRDSFVNLEMTKGKRLITGHTPYTLEKITNSLHQNKILLDGGCVYSRFRKDLGYLCALEIDSMKLFTLKNIDYK